MPLRATVVKWIRKGADYTTRFSAWLGAKGGRLEFKPRPDDVYLASYMRSGTTWLQMIAYQLTTDGNMDFRHITDPIPYFERALGMGRNLNELPSPRLFKTHLRYHQLPKGNYRRIYVARNGKDVMVSCFHFFRNYSPYKGSWEQFFGQFLAGTVPHKSWFRHVAEWSAHAADPNVLFIRYEDLTNHFERTVRRIAAFLNVPLTEEKYARVAERSSFAFMKQHEEKFDFLKEVLIEYGFSGEGFIREGKTGSGKARLTPEQEAAFDRAASLVIMPAPLDAPSRAAKA